jgi:hypothetical protein
MYWRLKMAKVWVPQPREVIQSWIDAIVEEAQDELNSWESNFIESISIHFNRGGILTQRQEEILEKIYAEKTD